MLSYSVRQLLTMWCGVALDTEATIRKVIHSHITPMVMPSRPIGHLDWIEQLSNWSSMLPTDAPTSKLVTLITQVHTFNAQLNLNINFTSSI